MTASDHRGRQAKICALKAARSLLGLNLLALASFSAILLLASTQTSDSASLSAPNSSGILPGASKSLQHRLARDRGCYYMLQHYKNGEQIKTDEPCLNCTCENSMLMCYLRVCPYVKPIGDRCIIERVQGECCPRITCPAVQEIGADQQFIEQQEGDQSPTTMTTTTTTSTTTAAATTTSLGTESMLGGSSSGCQLGDKFYPEGTQMPSSEPGKSCEVCYCIRNRAACVMQDCALEVSGCAPVFTAGGCCPTRYNCSAENAFTTRRPSTTIAADEEALLSRFATSTKRKFWQLLPGQFSKLSPSSTASPPPNTSDYSSSTSTTLRPLVMPEFGRKEFGAGSQAGAPGCRLANSSRHFADGERVPSRNKCEHCYCMRSEIVCAVQECRAPCDGCVPLPNEPDEDQCCPTRYECAAPSQRVSLDNVIYTSPAQQEFNVSQQGSESTTSMSTAGHGAPNVADAEARQGPGGVESTTSMMINDAEAPAAQATGEQQEVPTTSRPSDESLLDVVPSDAPIVPKQQKETSVMTTRQTKPPLRPISPKLSTASDLEAGNFETSSAGEQQQLAPAAPSGQAGEQAGEVAKSAAGLARTSGANVDGFNLNGGGSGGSGEREQDSSDGPGRSPVGRVEAPEGHQVASNSAGGSPLVDSSSSTSSFLDPSLTSTPRPSVQQSTPAGELQLSGFTQDNLQASGGQQAAEPKRTGRPLVVPSHVPGEGSCRYNGKVHQNGEEVKSKHNCTELCMCINSVVYCDEVDCPRAPDNAENCQKVFSDGDCCPKYICSKAEGTLSTTTEAPSSSSSSSEEFKQSVTTTNAPPTQTGSKGSENEISQPSANDQEATSVDSLAPIKPVQQGESEQTVSTTQASDLFSATSSSPTTVSKPVELSSAYPATVTVLQASSEATPASDLAQSSSTTLTPIEVNTLASEPQSSKNDGQPPAAVTSNELKPPLGDSIQSNTIAAESSTTVAEPASSAAEASDESLKKTNEQSGTNVATSESPTRNSITSEEIPTLQSSSVAPSSFEVSQPDATRMTTSELSQPSGSSVSDVTTGPSVQEAPAATLAPQVEQSGTSLTPIDGQQQQTSTTVTSATVSGGTQAKQADEANIIDTTLVSSTTSQPENGVNKESNDSINLNEQQTSPPPSSKELEVSPDDPKQTTTTSSSEAPQLDQKQTTSIAPETEAATVLKENNKSSEQEQQLITTTSASVSEFSTTSAPSSSVSTDLIEQTNKAPVMQTETVTGSTGGLNAVNLIGTSEPKVDSSNLASSTVAEQAPASTEASTISEQPFSESSGDPIELATTTKQILNPSIASETPAGDITIEVQGSTSAPAQEQTTVFFSSTRPSQDATEPVASIGADGTLPQGEEKKMIDSSAPQASGAPPKTENFEPGSSEAPNTIQSGSSTTQAATSSVAPEDQSTASLPTESINIQPASPESPTSESNSPTIVSETATKQQEPQETSAQPNDIPSDGAQVLSNAPASSPAPVLPIELTTMDTSAPNKTASQENEVAGTPGEPFKPIVTASEQITTLQPATSVNLSSESLDLSQSRTTTPQVLASSESPAAKLEPASVTPSDQVFEAPREEAFVPSLPAVGQASSTVLETSSRQPDSAKDVPSSSESQPSTTTTKTTTLQPETSSSSTNLIVGPEKVEIKEVNGPPPDEPSEQPTSRPQVISSNPLEGDQSSANTMSEQSSTSGAAQEAVTNAPSSEQAPGAQEKQETVQPSVVVTDAPLASSSATEQTTNASSSPEPSDAAATLQSSQQPGGQSNDSNDMFSPMSQKDGTLIVTNPPSELVSMTTTSATQPIAADTLNAKEQDQARPVEMPTTYTDNQVTSTSIIPPIGDSNLIDSSKQYESSRQPEATTGSSLVFSESDRGTTTTVLPTLSTSSETPVSAKSPSKPVENGQVDSEALAVSPPSEQIAGDAAQSQPKEPQIDSTVAPAIEPSLVSASAQEGLSVTTTTESEQKSTSSKPAPSSELSQLPAKSDDSSANNVIDLSTKSTTTITSETPLVAAINEAATSAEAAPREEDSAQGKQATESVDIVQQPTTTTVSPSVEQSSTLAAASVLDASSSASTAVESAPVRVPEEPTVAATGPPQSTNELPPTVLPKESTLFADLDSTKTTETQQVVASSVAPAKAFESSTGVESASIEGSQTVGQQPASASESVVAQDVANKSPEQEQQQTTTTSAPISEPGSVVSAEFIEQTSRAPVIQTESVSGPTGGLQAVNLVETGAPKVDSSDLASSAPVSSTVVSVADQTPGSTEVPTSSEQPVSASSEEPNKLATVTEQSSTTPAAQTTTTLSVQTSSSELPKSIKDVTFELESSTLAPTQEQTTVTSLASQPASSNLPTVGKEREAQDSGSDVAAAPQAGQNKMNESLAVTTEPQEQTTIASTETITSTQASSSESAPAEQSSPEVANGPQEQAPGSAQANEVPQEVSSISPVTTISSSLPPTSATSNEDLGVQSSGVPTVTTTSAQSAAPESPASEPTTTTANNAQAEAEQKQATSSSTSEAPSTNSPELTTLISASSSARPSNPADEQSNENQSTSAAVDSTRAPEITSSSRPSVVEQTASQSFIELTSELPKLLTTLTPLDATSAVPIEREKSVQPSSTTSEQPSSQVPDIIANQIINKQNDTNLQPEAQTEAQSITEQTLNSVSSSSTEATSTTASSITSSPAEQFLSQTLKSVDFKPVNLTTIIPSIRGSAASITIPWEDVSSSSTSSPLESTTSAYNSSEEYRHSNVSSTRTQTYETSSSELPSSMATSSGAVTPVSSSDYEETGEEPGCEYEGKAYSSAQQIPRSHPCDFCFCFRGDIICLQQTCPPPVPHCFETVIDGFCCPRYECPVHTVRTAANSSSLTLTPYETHSRLHTHAHEPERPNSLAKNNVRGCFVDNKLYGVGHVIESASGPCLECRCDRSGMMKCNPKECAPEDPLLQQINREVLHSTLSRSQMR